MPSDFKLVQLFNMGQMRVLHVFSLELRSLLHMARRIRALLCGSCALIDSPCSLWKFEMISWNFLFISMDFVGFDVKQIEKCVGDPEADTDNPVLKAEQDSQVCLLQKWWDNSSLLPPWLIWINFHFLRFFFQIGKGARGDVTILPTLVINNRQYRGIPRLM